MSIVITVFLNCSQTTKVVQLSLISVLTTRTEPCV